LSFAGRRYQIARQEVKAGVQQHNPPAMAIAPTIGGSGSKLIFSCSEVSSPHFSQAVLKAF